MGNSREIVLSIPATVQSMNPRQDRSWKLAFETRELTGDEIKVLVDNYQGEGWLVFKPNSVGITEDEIPEGDAEPGTKTPSQRLRARLYILWRQLPKEGRADFESFYRTQIEKFIEYIDDKIVKE